MRIIIYLVVFLLSFKALSQTASFTTSKDQDCNILKVTLDANASTGTSPLTYFWDFGNGNQTSGIDKASVEAVFIQPGTPLISLYVIDALGNKSPVFSKSVKILAGPKIDFTPNPNISCMGKSINFTNNTVPGSSAITGFIWNIGNEVTLTDKDPSYGFPKEGDFDVTLTAIDANGCNVSLKKEKSVTIKNKFLVNFSSDKTFDCDVPFTTDFKDVSDYSNVSGHSFSYKWEFGDGTVSSLQNPQKNYNKIGTFPVKLSVQDHTDGCSSVAQVPDYISVGGRKPVMQIKLLNRKCTDFTYGFYSNFRGLPAGIKVTVDFGNGAKDTSGVEVSHVYNKSGKYLIKTTFANPLKPSCTQSSVDTLVVPDIDAEILATVTKACSPPMTTTFSLKNIPDAAFYKWNFGDGSSSEQASPIKVYNEKGKFSVAVKVWSKGGCVYNLEKKELISVGKNNLSFTTDAKRIQEYPNEFNIHPLEDSTSLWGGCIPFTVNFKNTSAQAGTGSYIWDFGDKTSLTSALDQVSHTYTREGVFSPMLVSADPAGCTDTFICKSCVRVGKPPVAQISTTGPDTVCCLYDKTFASNVNLKDVDLLWYNIVMNDGLPSAGTTMAYFKDSTGKWIMEDNTSTQFAYNPPGLGLRYGQTNFSQATGNYPDFYFYAYKNGCPNKISIPAYQKHVLPWGTFAPLPCEQEEKLKAGDTLDFNKIGGTWILGLNKDSTPMTLSKAVVSFTYVSKSGCSIPEYTQTFTPATLGFDIDGNAFEKIRKAGLFPKIVLPPCAQKGDQVNTSTFLYTHDDATKYYKNDKCLCEEHWPYFIGSPTLPKYSLNTKSGCAPLKVSFQSNNISDWIFDDGTILKGYEVNHTFTKPGKYKFKIATNNCSPTQWQDSIEVFSPVAQIKANQNLFCLNNNVTPEDRTILLTESSYGRNDSLKTWIWDFGNGITSQNDTGGTAKYIYTEKDVPKDYLKETYVRLQVIDHHGCEAKDSLKIILRKITPAIEIERVTGCYDTLKITPLYPKFGSFDPYFGILRVSYNTKGNTAHLYENYIADVMQKPVLLNSNGTYKIHMEIYNDALGACYASMDTLISVQYKSLEPAYNIKGKTRFSCIPAFVDAVDSSKEWEQRKLKSWYWKFTNNNTHQEIIGTGKNPDQFALVDSGYYSLYYEVADELGCVKAVYDDSVIYINELKGKIDSLPPELCPGEIGNFKGSSLNGDRYFWDFGDGIIGNGLNIDHAYKLSGERNISFIVTDTSNCRKSYAGKVFVKPGPIFDLGNDTSICIGRTIQLSGPIKPGLVYSWNTGESSAAINIDQPGKYWLNVKDQMQNCPYADTIRLEVSSLPTVRILPIEPVCAGELITLQADIDSTTIEKIWKKNGIEVGRSANISTIAVKSDRIELVAMNDKFCSITSNYALPIIDKPEVVLTDTKICPGDSFALNPIITSGHPIFKYQWSKNGQNIAGDTLPSLTIKEPGKYSVSYGKGNCITVASSTLDFHPIPDANTNPTNVIFCEEDGNILVDGGDAFSYSWFPDGLSQRYYQVNQVGTYSLRIGNELGCYNYDSILVENRCPPKLYVPNAFTPELEGGNQVHSIYGFNIGTFELLIFNRWGEIIYQSKDIHKPWNGYYRNELMPSGVYSWIIKFTGNNPDYTDINQLEGKVVLVR